MLANSDGEENDYNVQNQLGRWIGPFIGDKFGRGEIIQNVKANGNYLEIIGTVQLYMQLNLDIIMLIINGTNYKGEWFDSLIKSVSSETSLPTKIEWIYALDKILCMHLFWTLYKYQV